MQKKAYFVIILVVLIGLATFPALNTKANTTIPVWDFEDHSYSHIDITTLTSQQILNELTQTDALFQALGLPAPVHYAYPLGAYNAATMNLISQYRLSGRIGGHGTLFPPPYPLPNWYELTSGWIRADTSYAEIKNWVDQAVAQKALLCLYTNKVSDPPMSEGCTPTLLAQVLDYLVERQNEGELSVLTMRQAYSTFAGQKAVVVMSFDDSWSTDYAIVWPMFKSRGIAGTSYIVGSIVSSNQPDRLNWAMISEMAQLAPTNPAATGWGVATDVSPPEGGTTNPYGFVGVSSGLYISAFPATGYVFSHWQFDGNRMTGNLLWLPPQTLGTLHTLTAFFTKLPPTPIGWLVSVEVNGSAGGTTDPSGLQNVTGPLTVKAVPDANYSFSYWLLDGKNSTENPVTLSKQTTGTNHNLTAFFVYAPRSSPTPSPSPSVSPTPTPAPTLSPTPTATPAQIPTPTPTPAPNPSTSQTSSPSSSPTPSPTQTPSTTPTPTPTPSPSPQITTSPSPSPSPSSIPPANHAPSGSGFSLPPEIFYAAIAIVIIIVLAILVFYRSRRNLLNAK